MLLSEFGLAADDPVFSQFVSTAPLEDANGTAMDSNDRIGWALGQTRAHMLGEAARASKIDAADPVLTHYINAEPIRE